MSGQPQYALLIGSSRFNDSLLNPLRCPEQDVDGMRDLLSAPELGAFGSSTVFKNAESHVVLRSIGEVFAKADREALVLIYYSGHGVRDVPGQLYLTTIDTELDNLIPTSISIETLRTMIRKSPCRRVILILDCCYSGAVGESFITRGSADEDLKELARGTGTYILTASTASQTAQERNDDRYGLLTKHIISGIEHGDADLDRDGWVSMDDLYRYVFAKVTREGYQQPMKWTLNVKGEPLIIARAGRKTAHRSPEKELPADRKAEAKIRAETNLPRRPVPTRKPNDREKNHNSGQSSKPFGKSAIDRLKRRMPPLSQLPPPQKSGTINPVGGERQSEVERILPPLTDQRAHEDARIFARLLISGIKLHHVAKINEGRRHFDLYRRLKDEIDRYRTAYDERVSPAVASQVDYFYDELVRTLAEGDPAKLGPGCPGPQKIGAVGS